MIAIDSQSPAAAKLKQQEGDFAALYSGALLQRDGEALDLLDGIALSYRKAPELSRGSQSSSVEVVMAEEAVEVGDFLLARN